MEKIKLLIYWQYDENSQEFNMLLEELNVTFCTCLSENISTFEKRKNLKHIYLYNSLKYYENAEIHHELDDEIISKIYKYERIAMDIVNRWRRSYTSKNTYAEIKRIYYVLLRFWNNYILENKINMFILTIMPHIPCTYIPYILCKAYDIPTILQGVIPFSKGKKINYILKPSIEEIDINWEQRYLDIKIECMQNENDIPLVNELNRYFVQYDISHKGKDNVIFYNEKNNLTEIANKYLSRARIYIKRNDYKVLINKLRYLISTRAETAHFLKQVEKMEENVDLNKKYYFFALHLQPEATTLPNGGIFADQLMAIRILAKNLPADTYLYVKEHPSYWIQKNRLESVYESRSIDFYHQIKSLKNVKLIKHDFPSLELLKNCVAVATITGTVGFEALFLGKPVLIFGHTFYENYPYAFPIKTVSECKNAIAKITSNKFNFDIKEMKLYLKAIEKYVVPLGANEKNFQDNGTPVVDKEDRQNLVDKIISFVREYY